MRLIPQAGKPRFRVVAQLMREDLSLSLFASFLPSRLAAGSGPLVSAPPSYLRREQSIDLQSHRGKNVIDTSTPARTVRMVGQVPSQRRLVVLTTAPSSADPLPYAPYAWPISLVGEIIKSACIICAYLACPPACFFLPADDHPPHRYPPPASGMYVSRTHIHVAESTHANE